MNIIGIYLFDQTMGMEFVNSMFRCTHILLVLIFSCEMQFKFLKAFDRKCYSSSHSGSIFCNVGQIYY